MEDEVVQNFPSWTGGVPRQMSEANLARRGGGIKLRESTTPASEMAKK